MNGELHGAADTLMPANSVLPLRHRAALADLAFGSVCGAGDPLASVLDPGRHLAFLHSDTLQLDLSSPSQRGFGDYELLELIGEGGMGVVYRARQISLDREVAIKLLAAGPWASRDFVERFRREAQNAARMQHPNIVPIYEVGTNQELQFFSMRLIRGMSLARMIRSGALPTPLRAAALLQTVAEAVGYAHRLDVLHLDLKPANVLLDEEGTPHVADFGLARRLDSTIATDSEEISGTPSYMAPERAEPGTLTAATDIWGLGAILYELVTGQPPFRAEHAEATLKLVREADVRAPRLLAPDVPRDLEAVILKCLRKDPHARYASARALADDLARFSEGRPVRARPLNALQRGGRWARREPKLAAMGMLAFAALLGGLIATTQQWRRARANAVQAATSASLANERLWQARIDQAATALGDGRSYDALPPLAANVQEREAQGLDAREDRIRIAAAERSAPRLIDIIPIGSGISGVALSPDGTSVAVATYDQLRLLDVATGALRWETSVVGVTHFFPGAYDRPIWLSMLRFTPDGRFLIGRHREGTVLFPMPSGVDEILVEASSGNVLTPPPDRVPGFVHATYSADGTTALVHMSDGRAQVMRTAGWRAIGVPARIDNVGLLPNGGRRVVSSDAPFTELQLHDAASLRVLHRYRYPGGQSISAWAASPDGAALAVGHFDGRLELIDLISGQARDIHPSPIGRIGWLAYSPDGLWLGAVADSGGVLVWDIKQGALAAPPMHLNTPPLIVHRDYMLLDAVARTVIAASDTEMAVWHLPSATSPPVRLTGEVPNLGAFWFRMFGYDAERGLIATDGGGGGELRLWRVQPLARTPLHASPLAASGSRSIDARIVDVEENRVTVRSADDGHALGPTFVLAQMPTYAGVTDDGDSLIALVGPELHVFNMKDGSLRRLPIALPNSPARIVWSPDSRHVFLLFANYADGLNREVGATWDLVSGSATSSPIAVDALAGMRFSADGSALLLWEGDTLQVLDAYTLKPRWQKVSMRAQLAGATDRASIAAAAPVDPLAITDGSFSSDGSQVDVLSVTGSPGGAGAGILWRFDANTGEGRGRIMLGELGGGESFALMGEGASAVVQRPDWGPLVVNDAGRPSELPSLGFMEYRALALAPNASMFARALGDSIQLTSTRSLEWLSPTLPASLPRVGDARSDHATHLVFSPDGNRIIGRSRRGWWLTWDVTPEARPSEELIEEAALLSPGPSMSIAASRPLLTPAQRQALRAQDPGPLPAAPVRTSPTRTIPARRSDAPANMVDLGDVFTDSIRGEEADSAEVEFPEFAPGLHRFLGVGYDVRGQVVLQTAAHRTSKSPSRVAGIRTGFARFDALHVLISSYAALRRREATPLAFVEIAYRDGSRARLPIVYLKDVDQDGSEEEGKAGGESARVAWRATATGTPRVYKTTQKIYAVRLVNPEPGREVASLALEASDEDWSVPAFFAITLESAEFPARSGE